MSISAISATTTRNLDRRRVALLGLVGAILVITATIAHLRNSVFLIEIWLTALAFGWRASRRNLQPRPMWTFLTMATALGGAAQTLRTVSGTETAPATALIFMAHLCVIPGLIMLLMVTRNTAPKTSGWWTEWLLLILAAGATTTQVSMMGGLDGSGLRQWLVLAPSSPAVDSFIICLVLRMIIARSTLSRATRTLLVGGATLLVFDLIVGAGRHRLVAPGSAAELIGIAAFALLLIGVLDPGIAAPLVRAEQQPALSGSLRLMSMLPLVMTPPALWALGSLHVLPKSSAAFFAIAQSAITLCALLLSIQSLRVVEDLAERDALTGLINRRGLPRAARRILSNREPNTRASLAVIDLNGFKQVNDRYGHEVGDELLKAVANRLRHAAGRHAAVCRVGGDEFVVIYAETNADTRPTVHTSSLAQRLAASLERPCDVGGLQVQASASIGVTPLNRASDLVQVIVNSDAAMYAAKKAAAHSSSSEVLLDGPARTGTDRGEAHGRDPDWRDASRNGPHSGGRDMRRYGADLFNDGLFDTTLFDAELFDAPQDGPASAAS